jgi:hypothetical protein
MQFNCQGLKILQSWTTGNLERAHLNFKVSAEPDPFRWPPSMMPIRGKSFQSMAREWAQEEATLDTQGKLSCSKDYAGRRMGLNFPRFAARRTKPSK